MEHRARPAVPAFLQMEPGYISLADYVCPIAVEVYRKQSVMDRCTAGAVRMNQGMTDGRSRIR